MAFFLLESSKEKLYLGRKQLTINQWGNTMIKQCKYQDELISQKTSVNDNPAEEAQQESETREQSLEY